VADEVVDLVKYLQHCGADITRDRSKIIINGPNRLEDAELTLQKDLTEIMTFMCASAVTKSDLTLKIDPDKIERGMKTELRYLEGMGMVFEPDNKNYCIHPPRHIKAANIVFKPFEGPYSDNNPLYAAALVKADGPSTIEDRVWTGRYKYADGFGKLGVKTNQKNNKLKIYPCKCMLPNKTLASADLRCAAAYVLAALDVNGPTNITNCDHLERGYEDLPGKLRSLGAEIYEVVR
jgi:UDP-N-acetylglucosamine 1-carboxyvinyltransferase